MLTKQLGEIDFTKPAAEIECLIRGLNPWPSAYTHLNGKTLKIWKADVEEKPDGVEEKAAGTVMKVAKDCFYVQTGSGVLAVKEVQLEGKKRMDVAAFLRGCAVKEGIVLPEKI
jgi:methionyl-tRNA formyltransferase